MTHRPSPAEVLGPVAEILLAAERETQLFWRATPEDPRVALAGLAAAVRSGRPYRAVRTEPPVDLSQTRRSLEELERSLEGGGPLAELAAARARELALEASLAEALHTPALGPLAAQRFPAPSGELARVVDELVARALDDPPPPDSVKHRSDDANDPRSLWSLLKRGAREIAIPLRVELRPRQLAVAATGDGLVAVRPGVLLSREASERVAVHELFAHALPRARSHASGFGLLRAGTSRSSEHEEGRALLIEERRGFFRAERLHELALRHRAALAARAGAPPEATARLLESLGATFERAVDLALRVHRGGGLARELVYLPSFVEVKAAFAVEPRLETWFEKGRMSLEGARCLERHGLPGAPPRASPALR
jgi:hypothetical protein